MAGPGLLTANIVGEELWLAHERDGVVFRIDGAGDVRDEIDVGGRPVGVVGTEDAVYVVDQDAANLVRIDPLSLDTETTEL